MFAVRQRNDSDVRRHRELRRTDFQGTFDEARILLPMSAG